MGLISKEKVNEYKNKNLFKQYHYGFDKGIDFAENEIQSLAVEFAEWLPWHGWHLVIITGTHFWKNMLGDQITTQELLEKFIEQRNK